MLAHQEGFGFIHFDDAEAAIHAAEMVKGDEHTTLDCQFSNNLCRSLDGLGNQSPRPLSLSIPSPMNTSHSQSSTPRIASGQIHPFTTTSPTMGNNPPISLFHNQTTQDNNPSHTTWPTNNVLPTNTSNSSMVPMTMNNNMYNTMPPMAPMHEPMAPMAGSLSPMQGPMPSPMYATQDHHTMVPMSMPMAMMSTPEYHPPSSMPSSMSSMIYQPLPPMNMNMHHPSTGTSQQGPYFYPNGGEYYYNHVGINNGNGMQPMNMSMSIPPPSTMYYNQPSVSTVPMVHVPQMQTMVPVYQIAYHHCVYPNNHGMSNNYQHQFPIMQGDQATMSEPIGSA